MRVNTTIDILNTLLFDYLFACLMYVSIAIVLSVVAITGVGVDLTLIFGTGVGSGI